LVIQTPRVQFHISILLKFDLVLQFCNGLLFFGELEILHSLITLIDQLHLHGKASGIGIHILKVYISDDNSIVLNPIFIVDDHIVVLHAL